MLLPTKLHMNEISDTFRNALTQHQRSFDALTDWMRKPEATAMTQRWLEAVAPPINPPLQFPRDAKILLTFIMMHQEAEVMFTRAPMDQVMHKLVAEWHTAFTQVLNPSADSSSSSVVNFGEQTSKTRHIFAAWKSKDKELVGKYLTDKISLMRGMQPPPPAEEFERVLQEIRALAGEEAEAAARVQADRHMTRCTREDLPSIVAATVKRAMWDAIREQMGTAGKFDKLFAVLTEMREAMLALTGHSERERTDIMEHFDVEWLLQRANGGTLDGPAVGGLVRYVTDKIVRMQAVADDAEASAWATETIRHLEAAPDLQSYLMGEDDLQAFVDGAFERMVRVHQRVVELTEQRRQHK
jgi:hypothetical protein